MLKRRAQMAKKRTGKSRPADRGSRRKSLLSGRGRYIIGVFGILAIGWFGGRPVLDKIKSHPLFTVRDVVVEGADYLDSESIISTASVPLGSNIFDIDYRTISERLKSSFAAENFTVYRRLPDTVAIQVHERIPVALLNANEIVGVDTEGVTLPHVDASFVETLPIVAGIDNIAALKDSAVHAKLVKGIELLDRISEDAPSVYKRISEVNVADMNEMGITLIDNGLEVIIGDKDWESNILRLESVVAKISERVESVKAVDIRFGGKVFVRKK